MAFLTPAAGHSTCMHTRHRLLSSAKASPQCFNDTQMASNPSITVTAIQTPIILAHSHTNRLSGEGPPPLNTAWSHQT
ncbi:hypothetical protein AV530_010475 [Patagioenas fasciata monilis]|uniref:Uncharacterized protein n=1 Tax=Patagioenas fasciata monilis TaxID=372326 RepID=A0A1V4KEZ5_PATFA|nr:hypothetical protein AV530_010475 [Patagioenas fasciata monilis]